MFIGHHAVAFAGKKIVPETSLGASVLAVSFIDLLWPIFLLAGWESVVIVPGLMKLSPFDFTHYPISHSLLGAGIWSAVLGAGYFAWTRYARGAAWMFAASLSHWFLDLVVHRPDLQIVPGGARYGFGGWDHPWLAIPLEGAMFAAAVWSWPGRRNGWFWSLVVFLPLVYAAAMFGPPPPDARPIAWSGLASWLLPLWAWAADRPRPLS